MGGFISLIRGTGATDEPPIDVPVDLEGARPAADEAELCAYLLSLQPTAQQHLETLRNYIGCGEEIRKAISAPSKATEEAAWLAVCPAVFKLREYYEFAQFLGDEAMPRTINFLCVGDVLQNLDSHQATVKQFADILHFVSEFDEMKMGNPSVQNDFSFYRRSLNRMKMSSGATQQPLVVGDELANRMSLFYAQANPFTKTLVDATHKLINENKHANATNVTDILSILAGICYNAIMNKRVPQDKYHNFLRVMVVVIILYDHIDPSGVFVRSSKVHMRPSIRLIQSHGGTRSYALLNSLRYSTVHLNDESTLKSIKLMLAT